METIDWVDGCPVFLDQTLLPLEERYVAAQTVEQMAEAICSLRVRGAPLIGVAAAYALALAARLNRDAPDFMAGMDRDAALLSATRPTAVNLFWAIDRAMAQIRQAYAASGARAAADHALDVARAMKREDIQVNRRLGRLGQQLIDDGDGVLTHCNAGALATAGYGTALGVIRAAVEAGKRVHVYADETRPLLQGARLTCWELQREGIPVTLQADGMAALLMAQGRVHKVVVGADRIAANGDTANKVGTYALAVLAAHHHIPFYVAAPESTIDRALPSGAHIPIEYRAQDELRAFQGAVSAPPVDAFNPAFDVTPAALISGIITQQKIYRPTRQKFAL